ncbi:MAG: AAA family ATPase [Deltaproteobacteria bacterium]|nr:AAA family ATPase [Deltaproteobacteria bacterium]
MGLKGIIDGIFGADKKQPVPGRRQNQPPAARPVNPEFAPILEKIRSKKYPFILIQGKAGTGKTTLVKHIAETFSNVVIVAFTGKTALNSGGQTIHSYFGFKPGYTSPDIVDRAFAKSVHYKMEILVIDEISMVRADLMDGIERFLRTKVHKNNRLFGGIQVVAVGDIFQLPPVVGKQDQTLLDAGGYITEYFFGARAFDGCEIEFLELTKIYRQTDQLFIALLDRIRLNLDVKTAIEAINSHCRRPISNCPGQLLLTTTNSRADIHNKRRQETLDPRTEKVFVANIEDHIPGFWTDNKLSDKNVPSPRELTLRHGAQVMFTQNDSNRRWVNGTIGRVNSLHDKYAMVEIETIGETYQVDRVTWEYYMYMVDPHSKKITRQLAGTYTQIPLVLAWAFTIHKSQGITLDRYIVDIGSGAFACGQLYVALSRGRTLDGITLARPLRTSDVKTDARLLELYRVLKEPK